MNQVSIVIPVYNEAGRITACLDAIAAQTVTPFEVIVVDNNSTDDTVRIAAGYPFVTVLSQPRQGVVYARDMGFDAVHSEIIGRIDADTVIDPDWVESLQRIFSKSHVSSATGLVRYNDIGWAPFINRIDLWWRRRITRLLKPEMPLQGANMALRRSAWRTVRGELCHRKGLHEDFDLAIHLAEAHQQVVFDESLQASLGLRCCQAKFLDYCRYWITCPATYRFHGLRSRRHMYPVIAVLIAAYPLLKLLYAMDSNESPSWLTSSRVNPATYVD